MPIRNKSIYRNSDVWTTLRCMDSPMVADVGVFQVANAPAYGYVYTLPVNNSSPIIVLRGSKNFLPKEVFFFFHYIKFIDSIKARVLLKF